MAKTSTAMANVSDEDVFAAPIRKLRAEQPPVPDVVLKRLARVVGKLNTPNHATLLVQNEKVAQILSFEGARDFLRALGVQPGVDNWVMPTLVPGAVVQAAAQALQSLL